MSNSCIPAASPVTAQVPPLPSTTRGEPCPLSAGRGGILAYPSGKLCVVRTVAGGAPLFEGGRDVLAYRGHGAAVTCAAASPSGAYVASGDVRGALRVWALDHEEHLCKLDARGLTSAIRAIAWDGESRRLAVAGDRVDGRSECTRALQWDTGVAQGNLAQHVKGRSSAVAFRPARPLRIATGGREDSKAHLHEGPPFHKVPVENGVPCENAHARGITCMVYTSTGALLASVGGDKSICIYEGKTMELLVKKEDAHAGTIYACAWSGDDRRLLTASADGTCKLFDVDQNENSVDEVRTWRVARAQSKGEFEKTPAGGLQLGCAFVDGTIPVSVSTNNQIAILPMTSASTDDDINFITGHSAPIGAVAFDDANGAFYTGDSDGIMTKWKLDDDALEAVHRIEPKDNSDLTHRVHGGAISGMTVLPDGRLVSVGWDDAARVTGEDGVLRDGEIGIPAQPTAVATGTKLTVIVTVGGVFLMKDGEAVSDELIPLDYTANAVCVAKDDATVYVGGDDCKIYVYAVRGDSLEPKHVIADGHLKPVHALALSNSGTMLAAGDVRDVCVYDLKDDDYAVLIGKSRWCFHLQRIAALRFSPDDSILASAGWDDSIYLWCLAKKGRRIHYPYAHRGGVVGLTFRGDSDLISVGADSCVVRWNVAEDVREKFG